MISCPQTCRTENRGALGDSQVSQPEQAEAEAVLSDPLNTPERQSVHSTVTYSQAVGKDSPTKAKSVQSTVTYSQTVGKDSPTKALERYSVYISLETPSR